MAWGESRKGPYATVYHDWIRELCKAKRLGGTCAAVFMLLCERLEFAYDESGERRAFASYSRKQMCEELGLSETAVKRAVDRLKDAGLIEVHQEGYRGRATIYAVMPRNPWPEGDADKPPPTRAEPAGAPPDWVASRADATRH